MSELQFDIELNEIENEMNNIHIDEPLIYIIDNNNGFPDNILDPGYEYENEDLYYDEESYQSENNEYYSDDESSDEESHQEEINRELMNDRVYPGYMYEKHIECLQYRALLRKNYNQACLILIDYKNVYMEIDTYIVLLRSQLKHQLYEKIESILFENDIDKMIEHIFQVEKNLSQLEEYIFEREEEYEQAKIKKRQQKEIPRYIY